MALNISTTSDCKKIVVTVTNSDVGAANQIKISDNGNEYTYSFPGGSSNTRVVSISSLGISSANGGSGIFTVEHLANSEVSQIGAVMLSCDVLCCLAKKMEDLLDCNCECSKCSEDLVSAQKIYLLLKTAEAELATSSGAGSLVSVKAVIANAEKKYNKAVEMCGGHCGCNC